MHEAALFARTALGSLLALCVLIAVGPSLASLLNWLKRLQRF